MERRRLRIRVSGRMEREMDWERSSTASFLFILAGGGMVSETETERRWMRTETW